MTATTWGTHAWETDPDMPDTWAECSACHDCNNSLGDGLDDIVCCNPRRRCPGYPDHADRPFSRRRSWLLRLRWRLGR